MAAAPSRAADRHVLGGHVVDWSNPSPAPAALSPDEKLALTLVLRRPDQAAFERFLDDLYDPGSPNFRRFLTQAQLAERFGPSARSYDGLADWLQQQGLRVVERSENRMTLTVDGTPGDVERAFAVHLADLGEGRYANIDEPSVPAALGEVVHSISGLSNLQRPRPQKAWWKKVLADTACFDKYGAATTQDPEAATKLAQCLKSAQEEYDKNPWGEGLRGLRPRGQLPPNDWRDADGSGQTIGLTAFDSYQVTDVVNWLHLLGGPAENIDLLSAVDVSGGAALGPDQSEVLLDIAVIMSFAHGANVVVYRAPFTGGGSFQRVFNRMLDDGVDIISNSWAYCENQTSAADVQSIDMILQNAAAAGVSVFSASGDSGTTCLNGTANVIAVPSGAPHLTAVGGTSVTRSPGAQWGSERWWGSLPDVQPTGQGGHGTSRYFNRPAYQNGHNGAAMRSIPDVVANADPAGGVWICQQSAGGCPTGLLYGGTSASAPLWAAFTAKLNQAGGTNLGWLNPQLYALANTSAFHTPAELQSDFEHVGLGSPNLNLLHRALRGIVAGPVDVAASRLFYTVPLAAALSKRPAVADGVSARTVVVQLRDANGHQIAGKTVQLNPSPAGSVTITPATAVTNMANGAAEFTVRNLVAETVTFTATDVTDGLPLPASVDVVFEVPSPTSGLISSDVSTVTANGVDAATLTVTLQDVLGRPTPGKLIRIDQGNGRATISGPNPAVTDAGGQIQFQARNRINETVVFTAFDVTDGDLQVPGLATVTYNNSTNTSCLPPRPTALPGFSVSTYISGVVAQNFSYSGVNWVGCPGASNPDFDPSGNPLVLGFRNGEVFSFGPEGGAATSPLATLGPTLGWPTSGLDGRLYALRGGTGAGINSGVIVELDRATGAVLRTLASNLTCTNGLTTDPISGDLFFDNACFGGGSSAALFRLTDPAGTDPDVPTAVVVYATLPRPTNGALSFAPNGTLYAVSGYTDATPQIVAVSATNGPQPPTVTPLAAITSSFWLRVGRANPDGSARSLLVTPGDTLTEADLSTVPPTLTTMVDDVGSGSIGPDGCIYAGVSDSVYRIAPSAGPCSFAASNPAPTLALSPGIASPDPQQGGNQVIVANLRNHTAAAGARVLFVVLGANMQVATAAVDAQGRAEFEYQGVRAGDDRVIAYLTVGEDRLVSNEARVHWTAGPHPTLLNLNLTPQGATQGTPIALTATLLDLGGTSVTGVGGQNVSFSIAGQGCSAVTDAAGQAGCSVTVNQIGNFPMTATFAGSALLLPATATETIDVLLDRLLADGFESLP